MSEVTAPATTRPFTARRSESETARPAGGVPGATNLPTGARVLSAVMVNVTGAQARQISLLVDGDAFSAADTISADNAGKVVYAAPNGQGLTTVYVYLAQQ